MNPKFTEIQLLFPFFVGTTSEHIQSQWQKEAVTELSPQCMVLFERIELKIKVSFTPLSQTKLMEMAMDIVLIPYLYVAWGTEKEAMYEHTALKCTDVTVGSA